MENPREQLNSDVNPETLKAFNMMWDCFPAVVMLLRKSRTIVALNKVARDVGIQLGTKCYQLTGNTDIHEDCMANSALEEGVAKRSVGYFAAAKWVLDSYWVPVLGEKDLYVHFSTDITEYAKPELFPVSE
ncbi:MAG: hypothetical protein V3S51_00830 [Dehalococcoidia bacterium]